MVCPETKITESFYVIGLTVRVVETLLTHMTDEKRLQWEQWLIKKEGWP